MAWDAETRAAYVEIMGPTWVSEPVQNFAGLEAAMAHIETHGTM